MRGWLRQALLGAVVGLAVIGGAVVANHDRSGNADPSVVRPNIAACSDCDQ